MPRYAIGDIQGCLEPLQELLRRLRFSADRDQLFFVGDLVNRGPDSLGVLRLVRSLADNAHTVLGNHDLHLLAHHFDPERELRRGDTLQQVLDAPDREPLMDWLLQLPLLQMAGQDVIVHAGLLPQWTLAQAQALARETCAALRDAPGRFLSRMYGDRPEQWDDDLEPAERHRFTINVFTRMRYCSADGRLNLKLKEAPALAAGKWLPWYAHAHRRAAGTRVVFGHWSTLGLLRRPDLLALDTGCVWGGALSAANLDDPEAPVVQLPCPAYQEPGE